MYRTKFGKRLPEISAGLLIVIVGFAYLLDSKLREQNEWVRHTVELQSALNDYEAAIFAAESGQRGFILSHDESYLGAYNDALSDLPKIHDRLAKLLADNPAQLNNLKVLSDESQARVGYLAQTIAARKSGDEEGVKKAFERKRGQKVMVTIRATLRQMAGTEKALLIARQTHAARLADALRAVIIFGILTLVTALTYWIVSARRQDLALRRLIAESEASAAQVRQMQKMEAIGQLTGGIAHDFNNMLAVIMSGINLALRRIAKGQAGSEQYLQGALDGAQRAATLVKRLLAFSKQHPLAPGVIDVNKFVSGMSELIARALGEDIKTETTLGAGLWKVNTDPSQLESAILNLCVNARDAMPNGGRLTVETANCFLDDRYAREHPDVPAGQYVLVAVSDTGAGMPKDVMAKAFDPFFTTKGTGKGTGLGLSQVYGFVKQSGGHLKIYSEIGEGTTVKIYLPRYFGSKEESARTREDAREYPGTGLILLVEDEDAVRSFTSANLRDLGYDVVEARNANEALEELRNGRVFDLLLTDIVMPDVNGRKLADEAVAMRKDQKVLFMTGFTKNAIVHNGVVDPGVHLLTKPFTLEELSLAVQKAMKA
ncbi:MAG: CHASE3 domain-containing protein [Proteobacteria bacterium]|nr:CHASE3 domain-containing protein [Pseudomonadota bacterium]